MKRSFIFRSLFCSAAVCLMLACTASAYATLTPESAAAYQGVIDDLAGKYGNVRTAEPGSPVEGMYMGLACARLIDFDNDGMPELYCAYGVSSEQKVCQVLYTYDGGLVKLNIPEEVSNFSTDLSPVTRLYTGLGKAYLVDGHEVMNGNEVRYLAKQGNQMVPVLTYIDGLLMGQQTRRVNGENMTPDGLTRALNTFTLNMAETEYSYWKNGDGADPTATISPTLEEIRVHTVIYAEPVTANLLIENRLYRASAYAIDGNYYLKLRDLAAVLNGSPVQFAVGWDTGNSYIRISTGRHYVRTGGELTLASASKTTAERAATTLMVDGTSSTPTTYIIEQNHYHRLRDLAELLNVTVDWAPRTKTVTLTPR